MTSKKCSKCNEIKPLTGFSKAKTCRNGLRSMCKKCSARYDRDYFRTKNGLVSKIYGGQKGSSKSRGHEMPSYTLDELKLWIFSQPTFEKLYLIWLDSGFSKLLCPSCDRLNDYKPYTLSNIKLTSWEENSKKRDLDTKNGINNKISKAVIQLNKDGIYINEYYSISSAYRMTGVCITSISRCCSGYIDLAGGFNWKYKVEE